MTTILAIAAAVAVLLWPQAKKLPTPPISIPSLEPPRPAIPGQMTPTYKAAIAALADVRERLVKTECLGEPETKAINAITLALVAGSDRR